MSVVDIIHSDALNCLSKVEDNACHFCVFSPPYDNLRDYGGDTIDLSLLGKHIYRVMKPNTITAMVIQDQTINGAKSLTSFRTAVDWCDGIGFKLFECLIYQRHGKDGAWWKRRFRVDHEYVFLFLKGDKPYYFNKELIKIPTIHGGKTLKGGSNRNKDGKTKGYSSMTINPTKCPGTVWNISNGGDKNKLKNQHPATFPDRLPYDLIRVFTREGDLVLDPLCGSGSTIVMAKKTGRYGIGIDANEDYCRIAKERLQHEC